MLFFLDVIGAFDTLVRAIVFGTWRGEEWSIAHTAYIFSLLMAMEPLSFKILMQAAAALSPKTQ